MGVPSESYNHDEIKSRDKFFEMLCQSDRRNYTMMSACRGEGEEQHENGLVSGHAYSLIDVFKIKHEGKVLRLLKLRNPWGSGEW